MSGTIAHQKEMKLAELATMIREAHTVFAKQTQRMNPPPVTIDVIKEEAEAAVPTELADEALHEAGGRLRLSPPDGADHLDVDGADHLDVDGADHLDVDGAPQTTPGYRSLRLAWDTATFAERKLFLDWVDTHQRAIIGGPLGFGQKMFNIATTDVPPETGDA